jgi:hypothetical protein
MEKYTHIELPHCKADAPPTIQKAPDGGVFDTSFQAQAFGWALFISNFDTL